MHSLTAAALAPVRVPNVTETEAFKVERVRCKVDIEWCVLVGNEPDAGRAQATTSGKPHAQRPSGRRVP